MDGIKGCYQFKLDAQSPEVVSLRRGPVTEVTLWKGRQELIKDKLPPLLLPKGLSKERQWYLYDKNRRYYRDECKDLTNCPLPNTPRPSSCQSTLGIDEDTPDLKVHHLNHLWKRDNVVFANNMAIIEELVQTSSRIVTKATGQTTGVELVCVMLTKHKLLIPI